MDEAGGVLSKTFVSDLLASKYFLGHAEDILNFGKGPGKHPFPSPSFREFSVF